MYLTVTINDEHHRLEVPDAIVDNAGEFFDKLDADMRPGWRMGREFVEHPDFIQRCQIVADRLLTALEGDHRERVLLFAAYLLARLPRDTRVAIDTGGEMQRTSSTRREHLDPSRAVAGAAWSAISTNRSSTLPRHPSRVASCRVRGFGSR